MGKVVITDHPLIQHKLSILRDKNTNCRDFRDTVKEISMLMCFEATRDLPLEQREVETPVAPAICDVVSDQKLMIVPILRAGLGMADGMLELLPAAKVGHVGMSRDPDTLEPTAYYSKLPVDAAERDAIVVDPMLATGGSAVGAIKLLRDAGVRRIKLVVIIAVPEGIKKVLDAYPEIDIYAAAQDPGLNIHGYIVPGLGDAGDRIFGTL